VDPADGKPIVFFDGVCGLCNGFVDFTMARDPAARFRFATLQGETAAALLREQALAAGPDSGAADSQQNPLRSVLLWENGILYRRSDAALRVIARLGGIWRLAAPLRLIPRFVRDLVYDFIARNRYSWFGKRDACRMPTPAERERFLP
jgi:predicted DCC family thiol-disulfide oxidoreductase YuxK